MLYGTTEVPSVAEPEAITSLRFKVNSRISAGTRESVGRALGDRCERREVEVLYYEASEIKSRWYDQNGLPLSNALLETYIDRNTTSMVITTEISQIESREQIDHKFKRALHKLTSSFEYKIARASGLARQRELIGQFGLEKQVLVLEILDRAAHLYEGADEAYEELANELIMRNNILHWLDLSTLGNLNESANQTASSYYIGCAAIMKAVVEQTCEGEETTMQDFLEQMNRFATSIPLYSGARVSFERGVKAELMFARAMLSSDRFSMVWTSEASDVHEAVDYQVIDKKTGFTFYINVKKSDYPYIIGVVGKRFGRSVKKHFFRDDREIQETSLDEKEFPASLLIRAGKAVSQEACLVVNVPIDDEFDPIIITSIMAKTADIISNGEWRMKK